MKKAEETKAIQKEVEDDLLSLLETGPTEKL